MKSVLDALLGGADLTEEQAYAVMRALADADAPVEAVQVGALLGGLRLKGETPDEVKGFVSALRDLAIRPELPEDLADTPMVDLCGTGGDGSGSLNLSTGGALLAAAAGAHVVKHGNRAISSRSGSADVLKTLGLPPEAPEAQHMAGLQAGRFAFLFAPRYHPALKAVATQRRSLGVRTVFNLMGPLVNPARPQFQVVGAFSLEAARLMAQALFRLPMPHRAFVVHGAEGWDEATPVGPFTLLKVGQSGVEETVVDPQEVYGIPRCTAADLAGGDAAYNAAAIEAVFDGEQSPHRHALVLGAALVLEVCGLAESPQQARTLAEAALDEGKARANLDTLRGCHR
ncbi:MAG: anthranilate phosphoribosyltransferase [Bradymonadia bacterium]